jgi:hypothetical protein
MGVACAGEVGFATMHRRNERPTISGNTAAAAAAAAVVNNGAIDSVTDHRLAAWPRWVASADKVNRAGLYYFGDCIIIVGD